MARKGAHVDFRWRIFPVVLLGMSLTVPLPLPLFASQPLETETARLKPAGVLGRERLRVPDIVKRPGI
jgi:hypothetical protein